MKKNILGENMKLLNSSKSKMSLRMWEDIPCAMIIDRFNCHCCKNNIQTYQCSNIQYLVEKEQVMEIYCKDCVKSYISETCSFCESKKSDQKK